MAGLAEHITIPDSASRGRSGAVARVSLSNIRAWPVARQFLLVLVAVFLVKQAINVVIFPPFSGHDEVAHYAYVRTVATEYRVPKIPTLSEFRAALGTDRNKLPGDFIPDDLFRYCHYVLDWGYCDDPAWVKNPPHIV